VTCVRSLHALIETLAFGGGGFEVTSNGTRLILYLYWYTRLMAHFEGHFSELSHCKGEGGRKGERNGD
jgi:hypothetical protein